MRMKWLLPLAALVAATMACQTILNPITNSTDLDTDSIIEPLATGVFELDQPDSSGGQVLLSENFSDTSSGWEVGDYDTGSVGYSSGEYFVISLGDSDAMWGVAFQQYENVDIEVDATQIQAPANDNNGYGVMCRVQENGDGYLLRVSGDGYYSIAKWSNDELIPLVDWTETEVVRLGNSTNQLRAICDGPTLVLEVNGQRLAATEDQEFTTGDLAFTATSFESDPTEVHFDNLVVTAP